MPDEPVTPQDAEGSSKINVLDWVKKFNASEKIMKADFRPKYDLAKLRLRAEYNVKNKNAKKMTHNSVNLVYSIGNSFVNSVAFKMPNCNLTAREEVDHQAIENTEIKVNDWLKDNKVKNAVKRIIWDAYLGGFGARFIDYEYDDVEDPNNILVPGQPEQIDPTSGQVLAPAIPPTFGRLVLKNEITLQRIRPDLVRFPKGFDFDNYQDSPWIGFDVIAPVDEVKNNPKWDSQVSAKIEGEKYSKLSGGESKSSSDNEGDDLYTKVSYCFIKPETPLEPFRLMIFSCKNTDKPLQMIDFDKGTVGYPIKFLYFNPLDDDCSYPNGDPWNFESMSAAIDTWWQKMARHVEKSNPKTLYDMGAIPQQEAQKLKTNNDLEYIGLENKQKRALSELIYEMQRAPVHPDVSRFYEVARQLQSEIAPRSGLSRGAEDKQVDTATEAKIINTGEIIDVEARIDVIKDFIIDIVLDVAGILEKSLQQAVSISRPIKQPMLDETGLPTGEMEELDEEEVVQVGREGFSSKINVDVEVESMQAQNKDVLFKQLMDLLGLLTKIEPILNKNGEMINIPWWLERILETRNIRNIEKGIIPLPPQPMAIDPKTGQPIPVGPAPGAGPLPPPVQGAPGMDVREDALAGAV